MRGSFVSLLNIFLKFLQNCQTCGSNKKQNSTNRRCFFQEKDESFSEQEPVNTVADTMLYIWIHTIIGHAFLGMFVIVPENMKEP